MWKQLFGFDKNKTFKPLKTHKPGTKLSFLHDQSLKTLGRGDLRAAVKLPEGEDENEWIATHTVDFYNTISLLYGAIAELCTVQSCPSMTAGSRYEYLWGGGGASCTTTTTTTTTTGSTKPRRVAAPEYIDLALAHAETVIANESIFPISPDTPFGPNFKPEVKTIFKRIFRIFAHVYHHHFTQITELGAEAHLNTSFKHFVLFAVEFHLVEKKEFAPLEDFINEMLPGVLGQGGGSGGSTASTTAVTATTTTTSMMGGTGGGSGAIPPSTQQ